MEQDPELRLHERREEPKQALGALVTEQIVENVDDATPEVEIPKSSRQSKNTEDITFDNNLVQAIANAYPLKTPNRQQAPIFSSTKTLSDDKIAERYVSAIFPTVLEKEEELELGTQIRDARSTARKLMLEGRVAVFGLPVQFRPSEEDLTIIHEGVAAKQKLYHANLKLLISIAFKYTDRGIDLEELIQDGHFGLQRAVEKFDERKGFKFSTYATWWIRQEMIRAIDTRSNTIRIPPHAAERMRVITRTWNEYVKHNGGETPSIEELAELTGIPADEIIKSRTYLQTPLRLDAPIQSDNGREASYKDLVPDPNAENDFKAIEGGFLKDSLYEILSEVLNPREIQLIFSRFGIDTVNGEQRTLQEVGEIFGTTGENIRAICARAFSKIRNSDRADELFEFLQKH